MLFLLAVLIAAAVFLRLYDLRNVPPGMHYDEIINGEIASLVRSGEVHFFYPLGWGREGLYHVFLAASRSLPLPIQWQMRLPSVLASLIGLLISYEWVRRAFGSWAAIGTVAAMAVTFWSVALGRAALRATLLLPFAALAAWLLVSLLKAQQAEADDDLKPYAKRMTMDGRQWLLCLALAIALGLSVYTYRASRVLPVIFILFLIYLAIAHRSYPRRLWIATLTSLVIIAPLVNYLITNPEVEQRVGQVDQPWQELLDGNPGPTLKGVLATAGMFGFQGDQQNHYNLAGRPVFGPIGASLFYLGVIIAIGRWRQPTYAFIIIWLVVGLLPGVVTTPVPHFIHTVAALPVVFVFFGLSVSEIAKWFSLKWERSSQWTVASMLVIWIVANAIWTYQDYLIKWASVPEVQSFHQSNLHQVARFLDAVEKNRPVAVCSSFLNESDPFWRSGRQSLSYFLNRNDLSVRWYDCGSSQVWPEGGEDTFYFFLEKDSSSNLIPSSVMENSQKIELRDTDVWGVELDASESLSRQLASLSQPQVGGVSIHFGDVAKFLGFVLDNEEPQAGTQLHLISYWKILRPAPRDMAIFVHMVNEAGEIVAQGDALTLLSDSLKAGDIIAQRHSIMIPQASEVGTFPLYVGLYSRTGEFPPLPIIDNGIVKDARLQIATIRPQP